MTMRQIGLLVSVTLVGVASTACGNPSVKSGSVDGGEPPGTVIINADGGQVIGDGLGTNANGGEGPGVAPTCTSIDPAKVVANELVKVPAGTFRMGCNETVDQECREDEKPAHDVNVKDFEIDKTEVTAEQWYLCVVGGKCTYPKCPWDPCSAGRKPISCVTHEQAMAYCEFAGKRLPTEAEWEKAARGTDGRKYPWGNDAPTCAMANLEGCAKSLEDVGSHPQNASPYGVLDMAGNVVEWTRDFYDQTYYGTSPPSDPTGPQAASHYVGRGGGFLSEAIWQRASSRDSYQPGYTRISMGVRCAR